MPERKPIATAGATSLSTIGVVGLTTGEALPLVMEQRDYTRLTTAAPREFTSGEGILYTTNMPSIVHLLKENAVAYTILERSGDSPTVLRTERRIWTFLVALAVCWGAIVTGLSVGTADFPIGVTTALFGCFAIVALVVTVRQHAHDRRKRGDW